MRILITVLILPLRPMISAGAGVDESGLDCQGAVNPTSLLSLVGTRGERGAGSTPSFHFFHCRALGCHGHVAVRFEHPAGPAAGNRRQRGIGRAGFGHLRVGTKDSESARAGQPPDRPAGGGKCLLAGNQWPGRLIFKAISREGSDTG